MSVVIRAVIRIQTRKTLNKPGFLISPSSVLRGGVEKCSSNWSRSRTARKLRKLEIAGADSEQYQITDYYNPIDKIAYLAKQNEKLHSIISSIVTSSRVTPTENDIVTPILKHLMENAHKNIGKQDRQRRHSLILKKFATLLLINSGSMAYDFIHRNMPEALPSLRTVQNVIYKEYVPFCEGYFRFDDLLQHLVKHKAPFMVTLAEDATRIVKNVEYDAVSNNCVSFVLPVNRDGLPLRNSFKVDTFEDIESYFQQHTVAKYAYVYMVQPLKEGVLSFCLACIGSDNKFSATDVLQRWKYINKELSLRGVRVVNFAADGDSRLMRAMRVTTHLISGNNDLSLNNETTPLELPQ